jgi:hypothetical protein
MVTNKLSKLFLAGAMLGIALLGGCSVNVNLPAEFT